MNSVLLHTHFSKNILGIIGVLTGNEEQYNNETFYEIVCINTGQYMSTFHGGSIKKVNAWKVGDKLNVRLSQLYELVGTEQLVNYYTSQLFI